MQFDFVNETITTDNTTVLTVNSAGALVLPSGTTAQQPTVPAGGIRWNTTVPQLEYYNGTAWISASNFNPTIISPIIGQALIYNGTAWVNASDEGYFVDVLTSWTLVSGNLYSATIRHQLNSQNLAVTLWNNATSSVVQTDSITIVDNNTATITITGNTSNVKCAVAAGNVYSNTSVLSSWTLVSGNLYSNTFTHNLNSQNIVVTLWNTVTNSLIQADAITIVDNNNVKITVTGNTSSIRCVVTVGAAGIVTSTWTGPASGLYSANINHGLGSTGLIVALWNNTTNALILADSITIADSNNITIAATTNATTIRCVVIPTGNSSSSTSGSSAATVLKAFSYYATSLDSPNNSDWAVNALAPTVSDPLNGALNVRQFVNTSETGVGFTSSVPLTASYVTLTVKGRSTTAPTAPNVNVAHNLYTRLIPNNAAITSWTSAYVLNTIVVPTGNTYYQYFTQTIAIATLGLIAGDLYQFELTRSSSNTNIMPYSWYVAEITLTFT